MTLLFSKRICAADNTIYSCWVILIIGTYRGRYTKKKETETFIQLFVVFFTNEQVLPSGARITRNNWKMPIHFSKFWYLIMNQVYQNRFTDSTFFLQHFPTVENLPEITLMHFYSLLLLCVFFVFKCFSRTVWKSLALVFMWVIFIVMLVVRVWLKKRSNLQLFDAIVFYLYY